MHYNVLYYQIKDAVNSGSAFYSVFFSSNDGFEFRFDQEPGNLKTMISNISIPTNFTGQQMQVQVAFTVNSQEGVRSTPLTVGKNYISINQSI